MSKKKACASVKPASARASGKTASARASVKPASARASVKPASARASVKTASARASVKTASARASVKPASARASVKPASARASVKPASARASGKTASENYSIKGVFFFTLIHLFPFAAFYTGVNWSHVIALVGYYIVGMLFIVIGYHRYFSHRAFKTNRFFQFIMAFMAQATAQKGALWWASNHRHHHKFSDTREDIHSPKQKGFWYSHLGWFLSDKYNKTDYQTIKDYAKYPELVWLNKHDLFPAWIVGLAFFIVGGLPALFFSFFGGIVILWHGTYTINSLSHVFGKQRYHTGDTSRNNWFLAIVTLGEGWHNNHHFYMHSARQGFFWYEYDIAYYFLKLLSLFKLVYKLRPVPEHVRLTYRTHK